MQDQEKKTNPIEDNAWEMLSQSCFCLHQLIENKQIDSPEFRLCKELILASFKYLGNENEKPS